MPFPEFGSGSLFCFVSGPYYLDLFSVSPLGSCAGHFIKPKVTMENATVDTWRLVRRAKTPDVVTAALHRGQEGSTAGKTEDKIAITPSCPQVPIV